MALTERLIGIVNSDRSPNHLSPNMPAKAAIYFSYKRVDVPTVLYIETKGSYSTNSNKYKAVHAFIQLKSFQRPD